MDTFTQRPKTLEQLLFSPKETFKRSAGHIGCNFDTFTKAFTPKVEKIRSTTKQLEQTFFFPKKTSRNCFFGHVDCISGNPAEIVLPKDRYFCSETENAQTITLLTTKKPQTVPLHP